MLPTIDARIDGLNAPLATTRVKNPKTSYNLGCGISANSPLLELAIGYNLTLAKKYSSHQGSIKLKLNL
jgi:hypothetical protein